MKNHLNNILGIHGIGSIAPYTAIALVGYKP
jgi:hypothetical protein